jgi:hypothetical protein
MENIADMLSPYEKGNYRTSGSSIPFFTSRLFRHPSKSRGGLSQKRNNEDLLGQEIHLYQVR